MNDRGPKRNPYRMLLGTIAAHHSDARPRGLSRALIYKKTNQCRDSKEYTKDYCCVEEGFLKTAARVEPRAEIVGSECPAERCPRALHDDRHDQKCGKDDLYVGEYACKESHCCHGSTEMKEVQEWIG